MLTVSGIGMGLLACVPLCAACEVSVCRQKRRPFLLGLLLAIPLGIGLWLWYKMRGVERAPVFVEQDRSVDLTPYLDRMPAASPPAPPPQPDDLKRIEGIGPKISALLQGSGILTYAQLTQTSSDQLAQILKDAGIRLADPTTWPEQAALAAAGDWDALAALQGRLKGGRQA